jgi:hypothetical protein
MKIFFEKYGDKVNIEFLVADLEKYENTRVAQSMT